MTQTPAALPTPRPRPAGVITRQQNPVNVEYPFEALDGPLTPAAQFYVRSHHTVPAVDADTFTLAVGGRVERPIELTMADLRSMPAVTRRVTLECAGNGRVFLVPAVEGAQWGLGAVGTAEWTGVPLADVLARAGVRVDAVEVVMEGADRGHAKEPPVPPGEIHYAQSIPVRKVDDVVLAYAMNGRPLPADHGFPLRAVVGGWYGTSSVKWLRRLELVDEPFRGYYRAVDYAYWAERAGNPARVPIEELNAKAQIARPAKREVVPQGTVYPVAGAAWTGDTDVVRVEVSTDGGRSFADATLLGEPVRHAWRLWHFDWHTPAEPGPATLLARATDARGRTQPADREANHGVYLVNHLLPCECEVG